MGVTCGPPWREKQTPGVRGTVAWRLVWTPGLAGPKSCSPYICPLHQPWVLSACLSGRHTRGRTWVCNQSIWTDAKVVPGLGVARGSAGGWGWAGGCRLGGWRAPWPRAAGSPRRKAGGPCAPRGGRADALPQTEAGGGGGGSPSPERCCCEAHSSHPCLPLPTVCCHERPLVAAWGVRRGPLLPACDPLPSGPLAWAGLQGRC